MTAECVIKILDETKKAVQRDSVVQSLNKSFMYEVKIDEEIYLINIEKYVPASQFIEQHIHLLTDTD